MLHGYERESQQERIFEPILTNLLKTIIKDLEKLGYKPKSITISPFTLQHLWHEINDTSGVFEVRSEELEKILGATIKTRLEKDFILEVRSN